MITSISTSNYHPLPPANHRILPVTDYKLAIITTLFCAIFLALYYAVFRPRTESRRKVHVKKIHSGLKVPKNPLKAFFSLYQPQYAPRANKTNLESYYQSNHFKKHAKSVKVYYNKSELSREDAKRVIAEREPTNIDAIQFYDPSHLEATYGHSESVYNNPKAKKKNGSLYKDLPNTACIYTKTYMWPTPGKEKKFEVGILSVPAPSLDVSTQPHFDYYVNKENKLIKEHYKKEMRFLAKTIVQCLLDHHEIKRLIIPKYGQENFLKRLDINEKGKANKIFYQSLIDELFVHFEQLQDFPIYMSAYTENSKNEAQVHFVYDMLKRGFTECNVLKGDIKKVAAKGDLIVNAWDPHSMVGNGNDGDNSFDGQIGRSTGAVLTCTTQLNPLLKQDLYYQPIRSK